MIKTHVSARKRHIEQNLTLNVDLDLLTRDRFKITFSVRTDRRQQETPVAARKRHVEQNVT